MSKRIIFSGMLLFTAACVTQVLNAQGTLVCSGTRLNGTPFTFPFVANTSPAPTLGVACVPSGKKMPKGKAVMGTAPKAAKVFAVVFVPASTAGGANTSAAGSASARLVCQGTRPATGAAYTLLFDPNANPAPAAGDACIPTGQPKAVGQAVMSSAPKTGPALAVVVPSTPAGGTPNANQAPNSGPPAAAPAATNNNIPPQQQQQTGTNIQPQQQQQQQQQQTATNSNNTQPQQQQTATSSNNTQPQQLATIQPIARSMADFNKLPQGVARAKTYSATFNNPTKVFPYKEDNSSLTLTMKKNPAFGGEGTNIAPKLTQDKTKPPDHSTDATGKQWTSYTDHIQLTATSTTFLNNDYSASASHIYPGAIYTFADFYNGSYKEQTGQRNPLSIMTDSTNIKGSSYVTIPSPNMGTIRNAIDSLFRETTNTVANESTTYQIYQSVNDADNSLKISGGASGYGASIGGSYGTSSQSKTVYYTIDAIKTLFSINTIPPTNGYFTAPNVEATPNLMVIGDVNYGMRVLANFSATFNSEDEAAEFNASYSGWGVSANVAFDQLSKNTSVSSTINAYIVGGPGNATIAINKNELEAQIKKLMSGATYKNAMPVKYEFYDMAGDVVGSNSATDSFAVRNCVPGKDDPRLASVTVAFGVGSDGKNGNDNYQLLLYPGSVNLDKGPSQDFVFAYDQAQTPEAGLEYKSNTNYTVKLSETRPATLSQFTKNGGALELTIFPNGSWDTWNNTSISVTLNFDGPGGPAKPITFSNINISNDETHRVVYFDGTFKPQ